MRASWRLSVHRKVDVRGGKPYYMECPDLHRSVPVLRNMEVPSTLLPPRLEPMPY